MERTPRLDWAGLLRRTFALDVFACSRCGGRRMTARLADALRKQRHLRGERILWRADGHPKVTQVLLNKWMSRIQRLAGHQNLSTTQRYMHLSPAAKSAAIRMLEGTKQEAPNGDGLETMKISSP